MSDKPAKFGLLSRAEAAWTMVRTGQPPQWFSPSAPMAPMAPPEAAGRRFDYKTSINAQATPRAEEEIGFPALRNLAKNYDILRICMETRKNQLVGEKWAIQTREGKPKAEVARIKLCTEFFEFPDKEHDWDQWSRMLINDMLEIDAATIYPRWTNGGDLYSLDPIDGATIKPLIDDWGRRPMAPDPAFQQFLHGVPADNYNAEELLYFPRNVMTHRLYAMGPVEQIVLTINTGLRRAMHKLTYYTEGTVPDALCGVPENWTIDQITEFQDYFDGMLTDNLSQRRKLRFVPAGIAKAFIQTKEGVLKDEFDEWLARVVCYALDVPNQWAVKQQNRATTEIAGEQADDEGRVPTKQWIKSVVDRCLRGPLKSPDLEFVWQGKHQPDPLVVAQTNAVYLEKGVISINKAREDIGEAAVPGGDRLFVITSTGVVPLAPFLQGDEMATESGLQETAPPGQTAQAGIGHNGGPALDKEAGGKAPKDAADKAATEDMAKRAAPEARLKAAWQDWLAMEAPVISWLLVRSLPKFTIMAKAAGDDPAQAAEDMAAAMPSSDTVHPGKPVTPPGAAAAVSDALGDAIATAVNSADWATIQAATAAVLREAAVANVTTGIDQVQPMVAGIVEKSATPMIDATKLANPRAIAYAEDQAARLVSGVEASTRNMIRATIVAAQRDGLTTAQVQTAIENSAAFSAERAEVIAKYELKKSSVQGNLIGWRAMQARLGIKINKRAILGPNEAHCAVCLACVAEGAIPVDDEFVAGDGAPFHPRCECTIVPVVDTKQKPASIAVVDAGDPMAKAVGHHTHGRFEGPGYEDFTGGEGL